MVNAVWAGVCARLVPCRVYDILSSEISAISTLHPNKLTPGALKDPSAVRLHYIGLRNGRNPVQSDIDCVRPHFCET